MTKLWDERPPATLRDEVKAFNAARKASREPCTCTAYQFPHRLHSGSCEGANQLTTGDSRAQWQIDADEAGVSDKDFK